MTDQDFLREWSALTGAPNDFADLEAWREYRDSAAKLVAELDQRFRSADEAEFARLQAKSAELQKRLGMKPAPVGAPSAPGATRPHNPVDETDWGMGIGGREKPIDPTDFRAELADLRDRTTEKRARRGAA